MHKTPLIRSHARRWALWLLCIAFPPMVAARALAQGVPLSHQAWSTEEGLPDASVHQVLQSRDGYIWLATEGGVARFDGAGFKVFRRESDPAFASNDVSSIAQDASGAMWFGTADGLVQMHGNKERRFAEGDGLPSTAVLGLSVASDGSLLVQTATGAAKFDGMSFKAADIVASKQHNDDAAKARVAKTLPGSRIVVSHIDRNGTTWIGTNRGLYSLAIGAAEPHLLETLHADSILSLFEDREGNLWIGTESSGLHVLRPRKFRSEPAAAGEAVSAVITATSGAVWFGTRGNGVRVIRNGTLVDAVPVTSLTSPVVLSLAPGTHGDVWVGTPDGVNQIEGKSVKSVHQYTSTNGMPDDFVRSLLVGSAGDVWAGTRGGLAHIEGDEVTTFTRTEGLGSDSIGALFQTPGAHDLWVGTSAGLSHVHDGRAESFTPEAQSHIVTAITASSEGDVWVGVHGNGLSRFTNGQFQHVESSSVPAEINALTTDSTGALWMRGGHSVYRASLGALRSCAQDKQRCAMLNVGMFDTADGLPNASLVGEGSPSIWRAINGELWFATRKGIAVADPARFPINRIAPPVVVERFAVDGKEEATSEGEITIGAGRGRFTFEYAALSFTLPSKNRYRYMLEGFDRGWIEAGTIRTAYYTNLPAKRYTFHVQAQNNDDIWNEAGATVTFRLLPPFYRRWWFYLLALIVMGALAFGIYRLRVGTIQRRFDLVLNERNRMAREIHDTLAQDFVSVSLQLDLATSLLRAKQVDEATNQLQATRKMVKEGLEAARQSIWNLRANTAKDSLPTRLAQAVERYAKSKHPPKLKIGGAYRKLSAQIEEEVLRIAQESLSNADRHAGGTEVSVELHYDRDKLTLAVRDNGRGFAKEDVKRLEGHYGLRGMKERAATLNAKLTVAGKLGEGTVVTLVVPLKAAEEERW